MSAEKIFKFRHAKHPTTALAGVLYGRFTPTTVSKVDQGGANATGRAGSATTKRGVEVEIYGTNYAALLALIGATAANLVLGTLGAAGANEKITIKNVYFVEPIGPIEVPEKDTGGKLQMSGVKGIACWGSADTFATMIVAAADV